MKSRIKASVFTFVLIIGLLSNPIYSVVAAPIESNLAQTSAEITIDDAFNYLGTQVNPDGGLSWMDESSSVAVTLRAVLALAANNLSQDRLVSSDGMRPIDYLAAEGVKWVYQEETEDPSFNVARAGQLLTAIAAANANPEQFGEESTNLHYLINEYYDPTTGVYGTATTNSVTDQVWAILGLAANNFAIPQEATDWLADAQDEEGRWNDGFGSYLDTTSIAILALAATDAYDMTSVVMEAGMTFMWDNQDHDGGWLTEWDTMTNASITSTMLQTISALGDVPMSSNWQVEGGNPYSAVQALQQENGMIGGDYANAYSTADALLGLSGKPLYKLGDLVQANNAFEFLFASEGSDGGWASVGQTLDVILAIEAGGWQADTLQIETNSPLVYLNANLEAYTESSPDAIAKAILGLVALGQDPTDFNGMNLPELLMEQYDNAADAFADPGNTWYQALPILGLIAAGSEIPARAISTLSELQQEDGGWEYSAGFGSWPDNTSLAIQALLASGVLPTDPIIESAVDYLRTMQLEDGGWGDASTSAYVIMALNALGESYADWRTAAAGDPLTSLMSYQKANGSFVYTWENSDDSVMATASAMVALFNGDLIYHFNEDNETNTAAIVIDAGEGEVQTACVQLSDNPISGLTLLEDSGFEYDNQDGFINSIAGIGNAEGETNYWSYWTWDGREWTFQSTGAGDSAVHPGTVDAWYFTSWEIFPSLPPNTTPVLSTVCENGKLLKDYNLQPYLGYTDLYNSYEASVAPAEPIEVPVEPVDEPTEAATTEAMATESGQMGTPSETNTEEEPLSIVPIIILGVLAVVIIIVVLSLSKKNKR